MKSPSKLQLPSSVSSLQDVAALTLEVRGYAKWYSHNAIKKRVSGKRAADSPALSPGAKELLHNWEAQNPLSRQSLDALIETLETFKDTAPTLSITLAAPPPTDLKQTLVAWCRQNIASDVLITFHFNSILLGGMVIRYGSRVFDWSFRRQILAAREKFPEVLRNV
jgi:hypothetical protein